MEFTVTGNLLNLILEDERRRVFNNVAKELAGSAKIAISEAFQRSVELSSYMNVAPDPEAVRVIMRSIKVDVESNWPPVIVAKFDDDYKHWYGGGDMPSDLSSMLQTIIDSALNNWLGSPAAADAFVKAVGV